VSMLEERLRAAAYAVAQAVPEGSAPPLRLPAHRSVARLVLRRIRTLLTPLGAATAVLGAVAVPLALPGLLQAASGAIAIGPEGTPPFYVAIAPARKPGSGTQAVIGSTASGKQLAQVTPPLPYAFISATGAASGRAFVLTAMAGTGRVQGEKLFLAQFDPARDAAPLSALPIQIPRDVTLGQLALSPDGRQLATVETAGNQRRLAVYSLGSGAGRSWDMAGLLSGDLSFLSWSANGTWVQYGQRYGSAAYLGRLNPDAAGGSLPAEVRLPVELPGRVQSLAMSPGGDLFAAIRPSTVSPGWAVIEYPARTWRPRPLISVPASPGPDGLSILWSSATGSTLIVTPATDQIGVISNGLYSALPSAILGNRVFRYNVSWS
jgi:Lipoprotein LpqB beta-propeller domain